MSDNRIETEAAPSYDPSFFSPLFAVEDRHFWFRARNRIIAALVSQIVGGLPPGYSVLEVGCGTGNVLQVLERACSTGRVIGMDLHPEGLRYARRRTGCDLVCGDMHRAPFEAVFDLIGLFDVLEHVHDDMLVLRNLHRMLKPGGALLLTVPAHMSLWSYFDTASRHWRRYEPGELDARLRLTGYTVEFSSQYMAGTFPLIWLGRRIAKVARPRASYDPADVQALARNELRVLPIANGALFWLLWPEGRWLSRRHRLALGTSVVGNCPQVSGV